MEAGAQIIGSIENSAKPQPWRLMRHGRGDAAWNMAVDEAMMRAVVDAKAPPSLRLYQWEGYAVSVGRFQSIDRTINAKYLAENCMPLVRRITGGRGILHGDDLTISIACRCSDLGLSSQSGVAEIYAVFTRMIGQALTWLGIEAAAGLAIRLEPHSNTGDCFAIASQADLIGMETGVKLVGGALHRREDVVLFQASAPLYAPSSKDRVRQLAESVFQGPRAPAYSSTPIEISKVCLGNEIVGALSRQLAVGVAESDQTETERKLTETLRTTRYAEPGWTKSGRSICDLAPN